MFDWLDIEEWVMTETGMVELGEENVICDD